MDAIGTALTALFSSGAGETAAEVGTEAGAGAAAGAGATAATVAPTVAAQGLEGALPTIGTAAAGAAPTTIAGMTLPQLMQLATLGVNAGGLGLNTWEGIQQREAQQRQAQQQVEQQQIAGQNQKAATERAAASSGAQLIPGLEDKTSGSLSPDALQGWLSTIQGNDNPNIALNAFNLSSGAPTSGSSNPGTSFFPNAAVPAMSELQQPSQLSGGNA